MGIKVDSSGFERKLRELKKLPQAIEKELQRTGCTPEVAGKRVLKRLERIAKIS